MVDNNVDRLHKAEESLEEYRRRIDEFLRDYLDSRMQPLTNADILIGSELGEVVKNATLDSGKRIRASFVNYGYRAVGGTDLERILFASTAVEILHSFFLIHDDVIDRSDVRRGKPTIHKMYQQFYEEKGLLINFNYNDKEHFASSAAIMVGDVCCALAYEALVISGFEEGKIVEALKMMQRTVLLTGIGEMMDIIKPLNKNITEEEVLHLHYLKTAIYTVEAPLHLGATLHGTNQNVLSTFSKYGAPVGIAFQIHDDILGMFGTEQQLGKPVGSDIKEGKQTLLTVKAYERASESQKRKMESILGNPNITNEEIEEIKEITINTGALDYSRDKAAALITEGKEALESAPIHEDIREILLGVADYTIKRQD